jgi:histidinol-phosphate/aromatic aminotransferase/cobyric acid decarboxylase-like protein
LGDVGVVVRNGADLGLPGWVRVSVGTPPVMAQLRAVLEEVL